MEYKSGFDMRKRKKVAVCLIVILLALLAYAALANREEIEAGIESGIENIENRFCPVTGNSVDGVSTYNHNGKLYNLCSPACSAPLSANPQAYVGDEESSCN